MNVKIEENVKIEDNVDFFAELKSALEHPQENTTMIIQDGSNCLITHDILEDNYITLTCGHKFNYLPLYHEVVKQKTQSILETAYLSVSQIKCPYCRIKTNKLLPYISHPEVVHKRGVNYPTKYCMTLYTCNWVYKSGKKQGCVCSRDAICGNFGIYCNMHHKLCDTKNLKKQKTETIIENWTTSHEQLYKKYNMEDLKKQLRILKLNVTGNKKILVNRLINAPEALQSDSGVVL
jgi:hypothetical protein